MYRYNQISDRLHTIWTQHAAKAVREASKTHQEEAVRAQGKASPALFPPSWARAAGAGPCHATAALTQLPTRALAWQKERGEWVGAEDERGGNLHFSLCKFGLAHTTRPHAKKQ